MKKCKRCLRVLNPKDINNLWCRPCHKFKLKMKEEIGQLDIRYGKHTITTWLKEMEEVTETPKIMCEECDNCGVILPEDTPRYKNGWGGYVPLCSKCSIGMDED